MVATFSIIIMLHLLAHFWDPSALSLWAKKPFEPVIFSPYPMGPGILLRASQCMVLILIRL